MTRVDRPLFVVLGLVAVTALLISIPRGVVRAATGRSPDAIPLELGPWTGRMIAAEDRALPLDPRSLESIRRIYESGDRRVWLGVARYPDENGPDIRPAPDRIAPTHGGVTGLVGRADDRIFVDTGHEVSTIRIATQFRDLHLTTWYWYRLGSRRIANEYSMRFWLGANTILRRHEPLFLVRVSTSDGRRPDDFVRLLLPHLDTLSTVVERNN